MGSIQNRLERHSFPLHAGVAPYRKPKILNTILRSTLDKTLYVLRRAIIVAAPAGVLTWVLANIYIGDASILIHFVEFLDPFARALGLDGFILMAFIIGLPANEIVRRSC